MRELVIVQNEVQKDEARADEIKRMLAAVEGIRDDIHQILQRSGKRLSDPFRLISELSGIEELRWQLGIICPVEYANKYPIPARVIDPNKDHILVEQSTRLQ